MSTPELSAAAFTTVSMGVRHAAPARRFHGTPPPGPADATWATRLGAAAAERDQPSQIIGWTGGNRGSTLRPPDYQRWPGPGPTTRIPPAGRPAARDQLMRQPCVAPPPGERARVRRPASGTCPCRTQDRTQSRGAVAGLPTRQQGVAGTRQNRVPFAGVFRNESQCQESRTAASADRSPPPLNSRIRDSPANIPRTPPAGEPVIDDVLQTTACSQHAAPAAATSADRFRRARSANKGDSLPSTSHPQHRTDSLRRTSP